MICLFFPLVIGLVTSFNFYVGFNKLNLNCNLIYLLLNIFSWDFLLCNLISKITYTINISEWYTIDNLNIEWEFTYNTFTISLNFLIIFIASHIQIYSTTYIMNDINSSRFIGYLSFFVFFMLLGILGNNLLQLLIG